jgi:pyruvate-ferredoxin/flavodoxin oxidoreductase
MTVSSTIAPQARVCLDGNDAAARVAYALSEVVAIYPITPASPMGEQADAWSAAGHPNLWGDVPQVIEMQSEAGAAGALHGAVQKGALATTFTASQGLLLMLPNMFKLAGELSPTVIHVAARTIATHALSIFGDHSDVMAARSTGFAMLASASPQEAQDLAAVAHLASLATRVPFLHFFDGFRTSHELNVVDLLDHEDLRALLDPDAVRAHHSRRLDPNAPVLRGTAQNPDVFFQAREAAEPYYRAVPAAVQETMDRLAERTGRRYGLVDYAGHPEAERVVVLMGSGAGAAAETVAHLADRGERVGAVTVRLFRPFPSEALLAAIPETATRIAVLDRTKEPGAVGDPLYQDVVTVFAEAGRRARIVAGRYGLSSKEVTPAMLAGVFDNLAADAPRSHFTIGIVDDVSNSHLDAVDGFDTDAAAVKAIFFGLGADGTVSASKSTVKIVAEGTELHGQGYFVYDSKKSGSVTVSHVRFDEQPLCSTYLIDQADYVGCHQFGFLDRMDVISRVRQGGTVVLNSPHPADQVWQHLPAEVQAEIIAKQVDLWVIDAYRLAREVGLGGRINTIMQQCFFALSDLLPAEDARKRVNDWVEKTYSARGRPVVDRNLEAVSRAADALERVAVPASVDADAVRRRPVVPVQAPSFVQRVTAAMLEGKGDLLPVSALPVDGTFPTATSQWEKRAIATEIPVWDPAICIDCAKCAIVCPHAAIRMNVFEPAALAGAPDGFKSKDFRSRDLPGHRLTIQVTPDDCTGCGVCVDVCPAKSKEAVGHKAIDMCPVADHAEREREHFAFFDQLPDLPPEALEPATIKGSQVRRPLFEFSGACAGCGETPYLKLMSQMFGDRMVVANATGCSSIYGGNLPTTPWRTNDAGRGPAWANSLFEDNAEFGLGLRLATDQQIASAVRLLAQLSDRVGEELVAELIGGTERTDDAGVADQRERVEQLRARLAGVNGDRSEDARRLHELADVLVPQSVWIVGGDGWAYDIGFGGLDHVLASGRNVNVIVLDTEVYSNTGGQASKATPRGATAKFAMAGKTTPKKDLGVIAMAYGNVYVAQIALGANDMQTVRALKEAEEWPGPSLILAYSTCIAHGIDMATSMSHQRDAVRSGHWPLYRFHPLGGEGGQPFALDSKAPTMPFRDFALQEARFAVLARTEPETADHLLGLAQRDVDERWRLYEQLATVERVAPAGAGDDAEGDTRD